MSDTMDEIPLSSLSIRGTEVAIGVNLHQCPAFVLRIRGEDFAATIDEGRRIAESIDWELARHATKDQMAFAYMREKLRGQLALTCRDKLGNPAKAATVALFWLIIHEPDRQQVVRQAMFECLMDRRAVVQIACGAKLAYATAVGVNARDMQALVAKAETSSEPMVVVYRRQSPPRSTLH